MKTVFGVGVNDYKGTVTYYKEGKQRKVKSYSVWQCMIQRCYDEKFQEKNTTYKGCAVSVEWLLYSNFKKWFDENYPSELSEEISFALDKDLISDGNKVYSEKTCVFLPAKINSFLTNKQQNNKTDYTGVSFNKTKGKFIAQISDFETSKRKAIGNFKTPIEAYEAYKISRRYMATLAKEYMRGLGIYSEDIILKIK